MSGRVASAFWNTNDKKEKRIRTGRTGRYIRSSTQDDELHWRPSQRIFSEDCTHLRHKPHKTQKRTEA
mgnify:CR=1 FL=1